MLKLTSPANIVALLLVATWLSTDVLYSQSSKIKPQVVARQKLSHPAVQFSISTTCWVPVGKQLKQRRVPTRIVAAQIQGSGNRTALLNEVIRQAPLYFPPNARVLTITGDGERFLVNLNRAFANARFWRGRTRQRTKLAFHALARNVAFMNEGKGCALPVQFVIEGRMISRIGTFQGSQALRPEQITSVSP